MTVFELNQANYANAPTMSKESLNKSIPYVASFISKYKSRYYLLLEKDQRYYTFFTFLHGNFNPTKLAKELIDLAADLGEVKSIEESQLGGMLEIWVVDKMTGECKMYGFFDYQRGTIEL